MFTKIRFYLKMTKHTNKKEHENTPDLQEGLHRGILQNI